MARGGYVAEVAIRARALQQIETASRAHDCIAAAISDQAGEREDGRIVPGFTARIELWLRTIQVLGWSILGVDDCSHDGAGDADPKCVRREMAPIVRDAPNALHVDCHYKGGCFTTRR